MPNPTEDNIANPCMKNSRYQSKSKLRSMLKKSTHSSASQVTFMPLMHSNVQEFQFSENDAKTNVS